MQVVGTQLLEHKFDRQHKLTESRLKRTDNQLTIVKSATRAYSINYVNGLSFV